jgi:hypothetical protein
LKNKTPRKFRQAGNFVTYCLEREAEMGNFNPETFWTIDKFAWLRDYPEYIRSTNKKAKEVLAEDFNLVFGCDRSVAAVYLHYRRVNQVANNVKRFGIAGSVHKIRTRGIEGRFRCQAGCGFDE